MNIALIIPLFMGLRGWQLIIVLLLILLLFGAKRIPSLMKNLGKSVHAFKQGMADAEAEINRPVSKHDKDTRDKNSDDTKEVSTYKAKDKDE